LALVATLRSSIRPGAVLLATALAAGACGGSGDSPRPPSRDVEVERVVSLVPTLTEIVIDLGGAERLVGIGKYDPAVPGRPDVPRLSDAFSVSLEAVTALEPDVVLVNGVALAEHLAPLSDRIRVETLPTDRLADVEHAVERVGELLGRPLAARSLTDRLSASMTAARERAKVREGDAPSVLVVVQRRPMYVAGGGSYLHELLEAVGATNAAGDLAEAWPVLSDESVVARAPDVVLDASAGTSDPGAEAEPITGLPASRVIRLGDESEPLFRAGPRLPDALRLLERLLYEETR
jgi:ABC-type Fe3+-hydroxamate transport system substrate-binding protein